MRLSAFFIEEESLLAVLSHYLEYQIQHPGPAGSCCITDLDGVSKSGEEKLGLDFWAVSESSSS